MTAPASSSDGGVVITLADVYRQMVDLTARVDAALTSAQRADQILSDHSLELRPLAGAAQQISDHETRLRALERGRWPMTSVTILIALASLAVAILAAFMKS